MFEHTDFFLFRIFSYLDWKDLPSKIKHETEWIAE